MAKRRYYNYKDSDMQEALDAVNVGMSLRQAARCFGVPKTILLHRKIGKNERGRKSGRETVLSKDQEILLRDWVIHMGDNAFQ